MCMNKHAYVYTYMHIHKHLLFCAQSDVKYPNLSGKNIHQKNAFKHVTVGTDVIYRSFYIKQQTFLANSGTHPLACKNPFRYVFE